MQENETKKFDKKAYDSEYIKTHYKNIKLHCKIEEYETISKFCDDMDISKNQLLIRSALYIINNNLLDEIK